MRGGQSAQRRSGNDDVEYARTVGRLLRLGRQAGERT